MRLHESREGGREGGDGECCVENLRMVYLSLRIDFYLISYLCVYLSSSSHL